MSAVVALLVVSYLLIDAFGLSTLLVALYGLFDPGPGRWRASERVRKQSECFIVGSIVGTHAGPFAERKGRNQRISSLTPIRFSLAQNSGTLTHWP